MINVGIIGTRGIPNSYGGFERFVELLVLDPIWDGEVHFVVFGEENESDHSFNQNYTYIALSRNKSSGIGYYFESVWKSLKSCDVILCCGVAISIAAFVPGMFGKKLVVNPDGCEWRRTKWSAIGRLLIKAMYFPALLFADRIVIDAEGLRDDFGKRFSAKSVFIPYQAVSPPESNVYSDQEFLSLFGLSASSKYVVVIARLEPENNVDMICEAFNASLRTDLELIIVGNVDTKYFLDTLRATYFDLPNIHFVGGVYDQNLLNSLRQTATAYIHGHTVGGTNPSLLEALIACEGSLLCHDNKYNREVSGDNALYFADVAELKECFKSLSIDRLNSRNVWSDPRYDPKMIAMQYYKLFKSITS